MEIFDPLSPNTTVEAPLACCTRSTRAKLSSTHVLADALEVLGERSSPMLKRIRASLLKDPYLKLLEMGESPPLAADCLAVEFAGENTLIVVILEVRNAHYHFVGDKELEPIAKHSPEVHWHSKHEREKPLEAGLRVLRQLSDQLACPSFTTEAILHHRVRHPKLLTNPLKARRILEKAKL